MRLDVVTPVIMVPSCLLFASLGPTATVLAFVFMPIFLLLFYQVSVIIITTIFTCVPVFLLSFIR